MKGVHGHTRRVHGLIVVHGPRTLEVFTALAGFYEGFTANDEGLRPYEGFMANHT